MSHRKGLPAGARDDGLRSVAPAAAEKRTCLWPRREILALAPAGLTVAALAKPGRAAPCGDGRLTGPLAIGFAPRDERTTTNLLDATALPEGDGGFTQDGARITIRGVFDAPAVTGDDLTSLSISVDFSPFQPILYHAWGFERVPVPNLSGPVSLTVPIAAGSGLSLLVDMARPAGAEQVRLSLAAGVGRGAPKLLQGAYILAWRNAKTGLLPDLARHQWHDAGAEVTGGPGRVVRHDWRRDAFVPANFDHVVLTVDRLGDDALPVA